MSWAQTPLSLKFFFVQLIQLDKNYEKKLDYRTYKMSTVNVTEVNTVGPFYYEVVKKIVCHYGNCYKMMLVSLQYFI